MDANGASTVLLVKDQLFFEIIRKDGNMLELLDAANQRTMTTVEDMAGFAPIQATRVIKGNGERVYFAPGKKHQFNMTGVTWYTKGGIHA